MSRKHNLNEKKQGVRKLARILFKREIANSRSRKQLEKMRSARSRAFDDDGDHNHGHEYKKMNIHRRASIRFKRISVGSHPFKTVKEAFLHSKGKGIAHILAKKHDALANKYVYAIDPEGSKKFARHDRASRRYSRIAQGKKPFSEEEETMKPIKLEEFTPEEILEYVLENVDQLDELSTKKMMQYVAKSARSTKDREKGIEKVEKKLKLNDEEFDGVLGYVLENIEELDELSTKKMMQYVAKSARSTKDREKGIEKVEKKLKLNDEETNFAARILDDLFEGNLDAMKTSFNEGMADIVMDMLAARRLEIASTMFKPTE